MNLRVTPQDVSQAGGAPSPIVTKIRVPRRRPDMLSRRRLVDLIHAYLDRKLVLISAAAGYGKTTLLIDFAHDTELPVCWYSLDPFDADLHIFLEHLIASIAQRFPSFGERSRTFLRQVADPGRNLYPLVATLVQEIYDTIPEYFCLILDDHHAVENQEGINEFLDLFVTYVDENCHVIVASRTLPALPNLSLLVARRQAAGLSIDELRFTTQEIMALALQNYDLRLAPEQANELAERTGGWITGLLLTAGQRWEQAQGEVVLRGRINVDLYDYLSKQVLDRQPAPLRNFLLESSVLDDLSLDLCTAVLGGQQSKWADLMNQVRLRNLFVTEYEEDDRLRYHDLFREFLLSCLGRQDESRFQELMRRAADAYAARGEWERAISRYLALATYEPVVEIVEETATHQFEVGRWDTLAGWIDALPEPVRDIRPQLLMHRGKIHAERGEHNAALSLYDRAGRVFGQRGDKVHSAYALVQKSHVLLFQGHYAEALARCREVLTLVSGTMAAEKPTAALAYRHAGVCQLRLGQLVEGRAAIERALKLYEELDDAYNVALIHHDLGLSLELAGDLAGAVAHFQAALLCWQQLGSPGPWANTLNGLGVVYHSQGRYDDALRALTEALAKARQSGNLRVEAFTWASLGDLHRDLGAYEQARQAYDEGLRAATRAGEGFVVTYSLDALGNISRLQGNVDQARKWLLEAMAHAEKHGSGYETGLCDTSLGILAGWEGDLVMARHHLDQAVERFEAGGFKRELALACLHRAQVAFLAGNHQEALAGVERTVSLVRQLRFEQFLVAEGQQFVPLLRCAASTSSTRGKAAGGVVSRLLERIEAHQAWLTKRPEPVVQPKPQMELRVHALGLPRVEMDGTAVQWTIAQSRDLFLCLLQHRRGLRREEIGALFWPEHSPQRLDSIFRSTLYRLRRSLFRDSIVFDEGLYRFNWECTYWFDVEAFDCAMDRATQTAERGRKAAFLEEALALYQGDYLEGIYADWCTLERERLREQHLAALGTLAGLCADQGDLVKAVDLYQRILAHDPYQEGIHRALMRCYHRLGDRPAAIRQYQTCVRILQAELGLSPAPETEQLYRQITS
jgi:ATP/maltotriose-dependent transcriptional regulator MalT/DNA-binding SARP family transcriptional activator